MRWSVVWRACVCAAVLGLQGCAVVAVADVAVTVVATGLGQPQAKRQNFEVINNAHHQSTGTDGRFASGPSIDYSSLDQVPAIVRKGRSATVEALANSGVDRYDIPAFLRKQAD